MVKDGRRSLGSNGDLGNQSSDKLDSSFDDGKGRTIVRVLTVVAYIVSVSTAAVLLSAYYVFLWVPHPSEPMHRQRPTDSPFSLAQHGNTNFAAGSYYHYPKNSYPSSIDTSKHTSAARGGSKKGHKTTVPPNVLPKPQHLIRKKGSPTKQTTPSPRSRY